MNQKPKMSLRRQFISRMLLLLIIISIVSGVIQGYILYQKINDDSRQQAQIIAQSIKQGIIETDLASKNIEHQIDLKLQLHAKRIGDRLQGRQLVNITSDDLVKLRDEIGVTGITIVAQQDNDYVNVRSTDPKDVGFSWKKVSPEAVASYEVILKDGKIPEDKVSYSEKGFFTLFSAQSGSHTDKPQFFKYAYYHTPNTDYIINVYIESSEVYNFIQKVGTDTWIKGVLTENQYAKEIAILDPRVFADPSLAEKMYPPLKQVVNGKYQLRSDKDTAFLKEKINPQLKETTYIEKINGHSLYKKFLPMDEGRVIYIALDYQKLSAPLYKYSFILIISGFISLLALFMFTANFFNKIYRNIQQIIIQIKKLESGDLTAKSHITDGGGELSDLSNSTNKMTDTLKQLLTDTHDKATKTERLSVLLENEANQSVEKVFTMSMDTTSSARETIEEIYLFLSQVEEQLLPLSDSPNAKEILGKMEMMRYMADQRVNTTTEMTITLSDLFKSLHGQSSELSELSNSLLRQLEKFKLAE
jgi:methyl-accepting chemotaxis protein